MNRLGPKAAEFRVRARKYFEKAAEPRALIQGLKFWILLRISRLLYNPKPEFVTEKAWDMLIVLDSCRFDFFKQLNYIPGKLNKMISAGSWTPEWLQRNFSGKHMKDVIYISANPYASNYYLRKIFGYVPFYKIVDLWKDGWDEDLQTVHPQIVNETAAKVIRSFPRKRFIIHYLQPHHPFIGDIRLPGRAIPIRDMITKHNNSKVKKGAWDLLKEGIVEARQVKQAYASNLQLVLQYVKELLPHLRGEICITSDHGTTFGRFNTFYSHPGELPLPELVEVPWLEVRRLKGVY